MSPVLSFILKKMSGKATVQFFFSPFQRIKYAHVCGVQTLGTAEGAVKFRRRSGELTDGIDVAPVGLDLGVLKGVTVNLAGAGEQKPGANPLGEAKHVEGPNDVGLVRAPPQQHELR